MSIHHRLPLRRAMFALFVGLGLSGGAHALVITEIMYHPSAADEAAMGGASLEWVEIYNEKPTVENLEGYYFSQGISFVFPYDFYLDGRSYVVVCANEQAVRDKYGITNTIGNFGGRLDNGGEPVTLNIFGGGPIARVEYNDAGRWPHAPDGTGHSLVLINPFVDQGSSSNWTRSPAIGGTPGGPNFDEPTIIDETLIRVGENWRYLKGTSAYPAGWTTLGFNDAGWAIGATGIGYGDSDDATVLSDMSNGYWSFAARKEFTLTAEDLEQYDQLVLEHSYDDGFVAYVNGQEVARAGLGNPGTPVAHDQPATSHEAAGLEPFTIPISRFQVGNNVLAIETHNTTLGSSDSSCVPQLTGRRVILPTPTGDPVPVVINECHFRTAEGWIEFYNTSNGAVDLSGFHFSNNAAALGAWTLPQGSTMAGRGYLTIMASDTGLDFSADQFGLYLTRPTLDEVVAAQRFSREPDREPSLDGFSDARFPDGTGDFYATPEPTNNAANSVVLNDQLVINEIMYHPPDTHREVEFIEFKNIGTTPLDLTGYKITRGVDFDFPDGTIVAPGGLIVVAANPNHLMSTYGISGVLGPWTGVLVDRGERIRVVDQWGNVADEVSYEDGGQWSRWADGGGSSLELMDATQDNSVGGAWDASDESTKSSWTQLSMTINGYSQQSQSELHIMMLGRAEVLVDDVRLTRSSTQYISNPSFESGTGNWIIDGNHVQSHRTTEDSTDGSACLKIVATGDGDTRVNRIETETSPAMASGSGYVITCWVRWLRGSNLMYFGNYNQLPQSQFTRWIPLPAALGTPGAPNSREVANLGPIISDVTHSPAVPAGAEDVTVVARVTDSGGVNTVTARYRLGSPNGAFSTATMFDDGLHGDGAANDGVFGGTLPGQSSGQEIVYYIETRDAQNATTRFPREAPERTHVYRHASPLTARSFTYRLIHNDADWSELNGRELHSNELLDATLIFNEKDVYYNVGTRYRGSPWNRPGNPRMYRVRFQNDDLFHDKLRAINFSRYGNQQRERAAYYAVWRNSTDATTSPMCLGAWGRVNTTAGTWTMEEINPVNGDYLRQWFPDDSEGYLMKITGKLLFNDSGDRIDPVQWASYANKGSNKASYRWNFNPRSKEIEDNFTPLISMISTMNGSAATLDNLLEDIVDVEQFLRVYAARTAHDDWDTISIGNGQNMYCYFAPIEGRWKLVPWDLDHSWGNTGARLYPDADSRFRNVINRPKFRRMYWGIVNEMLHGRGGKPGYWSEPEMVSKYLDRNHSVVGSDGVANPGSIRNFIRDRRGRLNGILPPKIPFEITTNSGNDIVVDSVTTGLSGRGWVDVWQIVADGEPIDITWTTTTNWSTPSNAITLDAGVNDVTLLAFDAEGALVGSDTIRVTSTVGFEKPEITNIDPAGARPVTTVAITGTSFREGIRAFFDDLEASVAFDETEDPTTLYAIVPVLPEGPAAVTVRNIDNRTSDPFTFQVLPLPPRFVTGDMNLNGYLDIGDAVRVLGHLYRGVQVTCVAAGDFNDDDALQMADAMSILNYVFGNGPPPPSPYPEPWFDEGPLGCQSI